MKGKTDFYNDADEFDGEKAYGAVLGTFLVCSWVEVVLAFVKPQVDVMRCVVCGVCEYTRWLVCRLFFGCRTLCSCFLDTRRPGSLLVTQKKQKQKNTRWLVWW